MELSAKSLADLIKSLRSSERAGANKRRSPRVGLRVRIDIWHAVHGQLDVWVRDVSAGGMNFLCPMSFAAGDSLNLILNGKTAEDKITCTVIHCRKVAEGFFSTGVRFSSNNN